MAPTTVKGSHPASSSRRCAFAITANDAPAPIEPRMPIGSVPPGAAGLAAEAEQHDADVARAVASIQVADGTRRVSAHSSSPARIGAEPSATTVPTATPLRAVPRKKSGW